MESDAGNKMREKKPENINLRSANIEEILGRPPGWLVRWGTGILFLVIVILLAGSSIFSYPDIVRAPVVITKENPPSVLVARASGRPEAIFISDGAQVKKTDTLAVIENPARYQDIFTLGRYVSFFNRQLLANAGLVSSPVPADLVLGEVQPAYNEFAAAWNDYRMFIHQDLYEVKIAALSAELDEYIVYRDNLERQKYLVARDLELSLARFKRDSALFASNVISTSEYENAQILLLNKQKELERAGLILSDAGITIARLKQSIADTKLEKEERNQKLITSLINSFRQLESSLSAWENRFLLIAPTAGILNYLSVWSSLQELTLGEPVFSIVPEDMGELHARIILPFRGAGKVRPGQRVNLKLEGYPFMEFGMVEGRVHSVSGGPLEDGFPAVISLTKGVTTSFGYELEVIRELPGIAEISTDEISLLTRLFNPLRHLARNRTNLLQ